MRSRVKNFAGLLAVAILLACVACGNDTEAEDSAQQMLEDIYAELDQAYKALDEPEASFENMDKIKDEAWDTIVGNQMDVSGNTSFALSAMPDHIWISINVNGTKKEGEWRP